MLNDNYGDGVVLRSIIQWNRINTNNSYTIILFYRDKNKKPKLEEKLKNIEGAEKIIIKSLEKLDQAAEIIKTLNPKEQYYVVSATEAAGSEDVNEITTQKKAEAVVKYLVEKGVPANMLIADGRGKKDLKYPECDPASKCPEWKNAANRRVFFEKK